MAKLTIEVESCYDCPYAKTDRYYTEDSFEVAWNYYCGQILTGVDEFGEKFKKIASYVERRSDIKDIPVWCPLLDEDERKEKLDKINGKFQGENI